MYNRYTCPLQPCRHLTLKVLIQGHLQSAKVPHVVYFNSACISLIYLFFLNFILFFYCSFYIVTLYLQDKYKDEEHNTTKQGQNIHKKVFYIVMTWLYYFTCYNCNNFLFNLIIYFIFQFNLYSNFYQKVYYSAFLNVHIYSYRIS